jgi:hypothetical protein
MLQAGASIRLFTVLCPTQEIVTYMETSPLLVKGCKIQAYAQSSGPLSRQESLSCHTCCDMGPWFFRSLPKNRPIHSPLMTHNGMWRIYSNPDPHGSALELHSPVTRGEWFFQSGKLITYIYLPGRESYFFLC